MNKLEQAVELLKELDMPEKQQSELCGYCILALADIKEESNWNDAQNNWIKIHDIIQFLAFNYKKHMQKTAVKPLENRQCMHLNKLH